MQLSQQWEENQALQNIKDEVIPGLMRGGLLKINEESQEYHPVESIEERDAILHQQKMQEK